MKLSTQIEAILYLKGQPLSIEQLCEYARLDTQGTLCDRTMIEEALLELMNDYAHRESALEIVETPTGYSLQLRSSFEHLIHHLVPAELGIAALRTLAVIALKSPILQTDVITLRGSTAYQHIPELVELGFVRKRRQNDGRSYWLEVTDQFHQYFEVDELLQSSILSNLATIANHTEEELVGQDEEINNSSVISDT